MNYNLSEIPHELRINLGSESSLFAIKSTRQKSLKSVAFELMFGSCFAFVGGSLTLGMLYQVFYKGALHIKINKRPVVITPDNLSDLIFPAAFCSIFTLIGLGCIFFGLRAYLKEGYWFIGTQSRFIQFGHSTLKSTDWEQFNGNIEIQGDNNSANLIFELRSGTYRKQKNGRGEFINDRIELAGISNAYEIEKICREKIKSNDPTPSVT